MRRPRGRRSSRDVLEGWTCSRGRLNLPEKHEFFDIPTLVCGCGCKQEYGGDFDFSLGDIRVNGHKLLGDPMYQGALKLCTAFVFAKQMEITKRVRSVLLNKELLDSPVMDACELYGSCERTFGVLPTSGPTTLIMMAQILKTRGIVNKDRTAISKSSNVSIIHKGDIAGIVGALADGFPLNGSFCMRRRFASLRYCRPYRPLFFRKLSAKCNAAGGQKPITSHSVVLVGAGRKNGRIYYHFMNSSKRFCLRKDKLGRVIRTHTWIGKIDAKYLLRNVIRLSRFKEAPTNKSFVFPQQLPVDSKSHNFRLIFR